MNKANQLLKLAEDTLNVKPPIRLRAWDGSEAGVDGAPVVVVINDKRALRHIIWWGIWLGAASSWAGLVTIIGPIAMTFFLTWVTGAALNEKGMKKSKPGYDEYVRKTSGFIPLSPKK